MRPRRDSSTAHGFTRIELVAVVAIVTIVGVVLLPTSRRSRSEASRARAEAEMKGIVSAVYQYKLDYQALPAPEGWLDPRPAGMTDKLLGDAAAGIENNPNSNLFHVLRAIPLGPNADDVLNRRRTVFIAGSTVENPASPKKGFIDQPGHLYGCYFDPWGTQYNVMLDTSGDRLLQVEAYYTDFAGPARPRGEAAVFALGDDRQLGEKGDRALKTNRVRSDDAVSWE